MVELQTPPSLFLPVPPFSPCRLLPSHQGHTTVRLELWCPLLRHQLINGAWVSQNEREGKREREREPERERERAGEVQGRRKERKV